MNKFALALAATSALALAACNQGEGGGNASAPAAQTPAAQKAAGNKTIASGLAQDSRFMSIVKGAGLDQTLAGPGPYTVLVPDDASLSTAPQGALDTGPENRARVTGILTHLILPGTVLAADIDKAIEASKGKAVLATMGGGTLTASKEDGRTILTGPDGSKATIVQADQQFSNGVVHRVSGLLLPGSAQAGPTTGQQVPAPPAKQ